MIGSAEPIICSLACPWRRPQPLHSWSPSARPPARAWGPSRWRAPRAVAAAVEEAAGVQPLWATLRLGDRARYMARAAQAVIDEFDELTDLIVAEQGRPRAEAEVMELLAAVETLQWLAEHGPGILAGEKIPFSRTQHPVKRGRWTYEPLGVVGVLGPATEPFATPLGDVAVALMAGNGVVLKPSPHVALCGERIARVFARAGLPEGLLAIVHGHTDAGAALVSAPSPRSASPARRAPGARSARRARAPSSAPCSRSTARTPCSCCADADVARAVAAPRGRRSPTPASRGGSVERVLVRARGPRALPRRARTGGPRAAGRRPGGPTTSIGPLVAASARRAVRGAGRGGRRRRRDRCPAARQPTAAAAPSTRPRSSPA